MILIILANYKLQVGPHYLWFEQLITISNDEQPTVQVWESRTSPERLNERNRWGALIILIILSTYKFQVGSYYLWFEQLITISDDERPTGAHVQGWESGTSPERLNERNRQGALVILIVLSTYKFQVCKQVLNHHIATTQREGYLLHKGPTGANHYKCIASWTMDMKPFFIEIQNFWALADKLSR